MSGKVKSNSVCGLSTHSMKTVAPLDLGLEFVFVLYDLDVVCHWLDSNSNLIPIFFVHKEPLGSCAGHVYCVKA